MCRLTIKYDDMVLDKDDQDFWADQSTVDGTTSASTGNASNEPLIVATTTHTKMMDRALAMLIYDQYVPFPTCNYVLDYTGGWEAYPTGTAMTQVTHLLASSPISQKLYQQPVEYQAQAALSLDESQEVPRVLPGMAGFEEKTLEELVALEEMLMHTRIIDEQQQPQPQQHLALQQDFSGWDGEMPLQDIFDVDMDIEAQLEPARQTLYLGPMPSPLGQPKTILSQQAGTTYESAALFLRSTSPIVISNNESSVTLDDDWIIA